MGHFRERFMSNREQDGDEQSKKSRRQFITHGVFGLAVLSQGQLFLKSTAAPTESSGHPGAYGDYLKKQAAPAGRALAAQSKGAAAALKLTEDNILGPFYREGAPFRAKITPPLEPGKVVLVKGRVFGFDTRKPLGNATIDIWQANANGRYDNDDPSKPPRPDVFVNRARLVSDQNGYYEFETIHPGRYQIGANTWRPSHIHYMVHAPGYKTLVTQLYFEGDPHNAGDQFIKRSLIVKFAEKKAGNQSYEEGIFDIVLASAR